MITGKNKFVFIVPVFNASQTLEQTLFSVFGQSYKNWRIILVDDVSSEEHLGQTQQIIEDFQGLDNGHRLHVVWNDEKKWEVANVLEGLKLCDDDDIVCRIDGDDWLTDLDALAMIDQVYNATGCEALWTMHRWGFSDKNISGPMSPGADPYVHPWVSSHLKTFRKRLLNGVNDENYRGEDGEYIKRTGDQAIFLPALHNTKKRVFLPRCMYHYTIDDKPETYQTPDALFQRDEGLFIRRRGYVK